MYFLRLRSFYCFLCRKLYLFFLLCILHNNKVLPVSACFYVLFFNIYLYNTFDLILNISCKMWMTIFSRWPANYANTISFLSDPSSACCFELPLITYTKFIYAFGLLTWTFILFHWFVSLNISWPIIFFILWNLPKHYFKWLYTIKAMSTFNHLILNINSYFSKIYLLSSALPPKISRNKMPRL